MTSLQVKAPAKVNLVLQVMHKRQDGYHALKTVMHTLELADEVLLTPRRGGLRVTCDHPEVPAGPENLAYRAAEALAEAYGKRPDVHIHIRKRIPPAAGLGGGSSDAAAVLRGLASWWRIKEKKKLLAIARSLGSDVPFFLYGGCALGTGRGEIIHPWPAVPGILMAVLNPGFPVATAEVYNKFRLGLTRKKACINMMRLAVREKNPGKIGEKLRNDLEKVTASLYPHIGEMKADLLACGASAVLMSGSGPSVFGFLPSARIAKSVLGRLQGKYPTVLLTKTSNRLHFNIF
ncbi:4-(cytidine 5'-diphospho)-2-C-methyl-D-erythritol kinase [candidate division FCPU426 bacterium]|nr:4-(cytidine 5'-diphospho)-2-C-methyl-D-erythritol kinase [candidate division FCPU426 bacterium]